MPTRTRVRMRLSARALRVMTVWGITLWPATIDAQQRDRFLGQSALLFAGGTVIDGRGGPPRPNTAVLIWDGRVQAVGPTSDIPIVEGMQVIDIEGYYIVPGFIDTHALPSDSAALVEMMLAGISAIRSPGTSRLAYEAEGLQPYDGDVFPDVFTGGPRLDAGGSGSTAGFLVSDEAETAAAVRRLAREGVDLIALAPRFPVPLTAAAVRAARSERRPVWADPGETGWVASARLGVDGLSRIVSGDPDLLSAEERERYAQALAGAPLASTAIWLDGLDPEGPEVDRVIGALLATDVVVAPLLAAGKSRQCVSEGPMTPAECAGWPDWVRNLARQAWPKALRVIRLLHEEGARLVVGSDSPLTPPGLGFHRELELLVQAGIPPLEVISMATRNAAVALGVLHQRGTIEPGKRADFAVLRADPVADIRNARAVEFMVLEGRAWGRSEEGELGRIRFR
jgi:cytosine/adenosine deaminase-related metal-dependent hydrolase